MATPPGFQPEGFAQAPEGAMTFRNPTRWEQGRMGFSGLLEQAGVPAGGAQNIAEFVVPGSGTEAGIQAGLALTPGVGPLLSRYAPTLAKTAPTLFNILQRSGRVALPAAGGATGAQATGQSPTAGAARGAAVGAVGEALPMAAEWVGRAASKGPMEHRMAAGLGKAIGESATTLPKMTTADDIIQTTVRNKGLGAIGAAHDLALNDISEQLKARTLTGGRVLVPPSGPSFTPRVGRPAGHDVIEVPALREVAGKADFKFRDAVGWLKTLADEGWLISQREKSGVDAVQARALRAKAREQIVAALNQAEKGLGDNFNRAQSLYDKGRLYVDLFRQPGVVKDGRLDVNALRDALGKKDVSGTHTWGEAIDRASRANPQEAEAFFRALFRGGPFTGRDEPGSFGVHLGVSHGPPHLGFSRPRLPSYSGDPVQLPWYVRPGSLSRGALPISFGALGLTREPGAE